MFKWGKQTVVFKVGACLSGGFLSAYHFESLVFSPCCPTPTLTCSFCWLLAKRSVHSATSWKPIVTSDSGKVMHHSLGKTENYIWDIKWHLQGIIHLEYFALFHSQGICLLQGQSQVSNICMKSLTRWFYVMNTLQLLSYA